jgi:hypothetical protein
MVQVEERQTFGPLRAQRVADQRRFLAVRVDPGAGLLTSRRRKPEVVDVRVRQYHRLQVADPPLLLLDPARELVPGGRESGVDRREPFAVLDQVPVDDAVGLESVYAVGQLFSVHAGGATRGRGP